MNVSSLGKRIDYKSAGSGPSLELPPDLTTPQYDDRYQVTTAVGLAATEREHGRRRRSSCPSTPATRAIARAGNERWLVVKATPEQAWTTRARVLAGERLRARHRATRSSASWKPTGPRTAPRSRRTCSASTSASTSTCSTRRTSATSSARGIERGTEPGTVEIYISHRGMEQVPTAKIDNRQPAAFAWAVMPPNPESRSRDAVAA